MTTPPPSGGGVVTFANWHNNVIRNVWDTPATYVTTTAELVAAAYLWNAAYAGPSDSAAVDLAARTGNTDILWAAASWTRPEGPSATLLDTVEQYAAAGQLTDRHYRLPASAAHRLAHSPVGAATGLWAVRGVLRSPARELLTRNFTTANVDALFAATPEPNGLTAAAVAAIVRHTSTLPDALQPYCTPDVVAFVDAYADMPEVCPPTLTEAVKAYLPDPAAAGGDPHTLLGRLAPT